MALRRGGRGWALAIPLALLALYAIQPSGAFEYGVVGARSVSASVVADGSAYVSLSHSGTGCPVISPLSGGTCTITITNKADTALTFSATETADVDDSTSSYQITGGSSVNNPSTTTTASEIAVGNSASVTINVGGCAFGCSGRAVYYTLEGTKAGVLNSQVTNYKIVIQS